MKLSAAGELALLRELERRGLATGQDAEGAILGGGRVATVDVLAEGIHFRLDWTSFRDLGYKAAAVNLSDLAAMGAEAEGLLVGLGAPAEAEVEQVVELYEGLNEAGVPVRSGRHHAGSVLVPVRDRLRHEQARAGPCGRGSR